MSPAPLPYQCEGEQLSLSSELPAESMLMLFVRSPVTHHSDFCDNMFWARACPCF